MTSRMVESKARGRKKEWTGWVGVVVEGVEPAVVLVMGRGTDEEKQK